MDCFLAEVIGDGVAISLDPACGFGVRFTGMLRYGPFMCV